MLSERKKDSIKTGISKIVHSRMTAQLASKLLAGIIRMAVEGIRNHKPGPKKYIPVRHRTPTTNTPETNQRAENRQSEIDEIYDNWLDPEPEPERPMCDASSGFCNHNH